MVAVTFINPTTDQRLRVDELDELMTVREALDNLIQQNFISAATNGLHYSLDIKGKTALTNGDSTLASGGIANGDTILVTQVQRGGCHA